MAATSVSTLAIRALVAKMANATDASIKVATESVIDSAESLKSSIGGSSWFSLWDPQGPERTQQQKNLQDAIDQLKASKNTESKKKNLLYLQSTIEVSKAFYGSNDALSRAFQAFVDDVAAAPALLIDKVVAPVVTGVVKTAGKVGSSVVWVTVKNFWWVFVILAVVLVGYGAITRRLAK